MVYKNKENKIYIILLAIVFFVYSFGQLFSLFTSASFLRIHLLDFVVFLTSVYFLYKGFPVTMRIKSFFSILFFGYLFSLFIFGFHIESLMYMIRLFFYFLFIEGIMFNVDVNYDLKNKLANLIYISGFLISIIGLFQYIFVPDLTHLKIVGWDDHFYRLTFPFLDPAFTGVILTINLFFSLNIKRLVLRNLLILFYLLAIVATFSRSTYLSVLIGLILLSFKYINKKYLIGVVVSVLLLLLLLPKPGGEGVNLLRVNSILAKSQNYIESLSIIKKYPVFGVGYNNLCFVRNDTFLLGNSCFGLDNSFLFITTTTGVIGFFVYVFYLKEIYNRIEISKRGEIAKIILLMVIIHSFFTNTLFYPWVMVLLFSVIAVSSKKS